MIQLQIAPNIHSSKGLEYDEELCSMTLLEIHTVGDLLDGTDWVWSGALFNTEFLLHSWTNDWLYQNWGIWVNLSDVERHLAILKNPGFVNLDSLLSVLLYTWWRVSIPNAICWNQSRRRSRPQKEYVVPEMSSYFDLAQPQLTFHRVTGSIPDAIPQPLRTDTNKFIGKVKRTFRLNQWTCKAARRLYGEAEALYQDWLMHALKHSEVGFNEGAIATMLQRLKSYPERSEFYKDGRCQYTQQFVEGYHILGYVLYRKAIEELTGGN